MYLAHLYEFDNTIFDNMVWPQETDATLAVQAILFKCGLLTPVYGEPALNKQTNTFWSQSNLFEMEQVWKALRSDYNPIENYDRYTDSKRDIIDNGTYSTDVDSTTTSKISPFDTGGFQNSDQTTSDSGTHGASGNDRDDIYNEHTHGNIGVTTTQQMIQQEIKLRKKSFYDWVADKYANDMCLGVWD